tara:strand:+ start:824 stop:1057 length:234 start_codon:yes stop_codon:yes gene_type:complete
MTDKYITPIKAIRHYYIECSGGSMKEVELCPIKRCELFAYRFGKNPFTKKRALSPTHKAKVMKNLVARSQKIQEAAE